MTTSPALFLHSFSPSTLSDTLSAHVLRGLSQRALLMANANDIVCCDQQPDADYLAYLKDFDIAPQDIIVPADTEKTNSSLAERLLADKPLLTALRKKHRTLESYMVTTAEWQIANILGYAINSSNPDYVAYLNQKNNLNSILAESNLPYLPMLNCTTNELKATALKAYQHYGKLVIRASLGLGSQNVWLANNENDIKNIHETIAIENDATERHYVISPFIANTQSLNVQFLLLPTTINFIGLSQQHIDATLHYHGNSKATISATLEQQVLTQSHQLADYLHQQGYRGYIGFDLIVKQHPQANKTKLFIIEINPRINTSTFTIMAVKRIMGSLDNTCFANAYLPIPATISNFRQFERCLQSQSLLLRPDSHTGILPLMSPIAEKNIDIIAIAPTHNAVRQLLKNVDILELSV